MRIGKVEQGCPTGGLQDACDLQGFNVQALGSYPAAAPLSLWLLMQQGALSIPSLSQLSFPVPAPREQDDAPRKPAAQCSKGAEVRATCMVQQRVRVDMLACLGVWAGGLWLTLVKPPSYVALVGAASGCSEVEES